jgi:hypothetical protein
MADKREDRDPPADNGISDDDFSRLIEQSSLGTPGARSLRKRVAPRQVEAVWGRIDSSQPQDRAGESEHAVTNPQGSFRAIDFL